MGWIHIESMEFYAYHGHFEEERVVGNDFIVDVKIKTDLKPAGLSDQIEDALDYQEIYNIIQEQMQIKSSLLEHVADRIMTAIYIKFPNQIEKVKLKISKLNPPLKGKIGRVSVIMKR